MGFPKVWSKDWWIWRISMEKLKKIAAAATKHAANPKNWWKGIAAAAVGGAAGAIAATATSPELFDIATTEGLRAIGKIAGAGALISVAAYLKQSPLPPARGAR